MQTVLLYVLTVSKASSQKNIFSFWDLQIKSSRVKAFLARNLTIQKLQYKYVKKCYEKFTQFTNIFALLTTAQFQKLNSWINIL